MSAAVDDNDNSSTMEGMDFKEVAQVYLAAFLRDSCNGKWLNKDYDGVRDSTHLQQFLQVHPELAKERFSIDGGKTKHFPLVYCLAAQPSLEMMKKIYELYPEALQIEDDNLGYHPLEAAIIFGCSHDIIKFLVIKYAGDPDESTYHSVYRRYHPPLYHIRHLVERVGTHNLIGERKNNVNKYIKLLYEANPPKFSPYTCWWERTLKGLLKNPEISPELLVWIAKREKDHNNGCIIDFSTEEEISAGPLIENLKHFVPMLDDCQFLRFHDGGLVGLEFLVRLFSEVNFPPTLQVRFDYCHIVGPCNLDAAHSAAWSDCQIQDLRMMNVSVGSTEDFACFLKCLRALPNLRKLRLRGFSDDDVVLSPNAIMELLEMGRLDFLEVSRWKIADEEELALALQQPTTKSTAFVKYEQGRGFNYHCKIAYLSAMNHHGRAKIAAPTASRNLLVDCLGSVETNCQLHPLHKLKESLWYGLLRQAPGLWATTAVADAASHQKKRPVDADCEKQEMNKKAK